MKALILDIKRNQWESTRGMTFADIEAPVLDEARCREDAGRVLIKPRYTGFCGSDKGIWFRHAFKDLIFDSLEESGRPYRICGHELLGEIVETGSYAARHYGYRPGDIVSTESHIFCGMCVRIISLSASAPTAASPRLSSCPPRNCGKPISAASARRWRRFRSPWATPCTLPAASTCAAEPWPSSAAAPSGCSPFWWRGRWGRRRSSVWTLTKKISSSPSGSASTP